MDKSMALLILGIDEKNLTQDTINKAYENTKGQFSDELLNQAKTTLINSIEEVNEDDLKKGINEVSDSIKIIKDELNKIETKFNKLEKDYDKFQKENVKNVMDNSTRKRQVEDFINLLNSNAEALMNQMLMSTTSKDEFEVLKAKREKLLQAISSSENELNALKYMIKKEELNSNKIVEQEPIAYEPEPTVEESKVEEPTIVEQPPVVEEPKVAVEDNKVEEPVVEDEVPPEEIEEYVEEPINNEIEENKEEQQEFKEEDEKFLKELKNEIKNSKKEQTGVVAVPENIFSYFDNNIQTNDVKEEQPKEDKKEDAIAPFINRIPFVDQVKNLQNQQTETKGNFVWTYTENEPKEDKERYQDSVVVENKKEKTNDNQKTHKKKKKTTGYILTKSYQTTAKKKKNNYKLKKDKHKIKKKPNSFIERLKLKIKKVKMEKDVNDTVFIIRERAKEIYNDYLKIAKIEEIINGLDRRSPYRVQYEKLIDNLYTGKQDQINYLELRISKLNEYKSINPNIIEDMQRMIAYELPVKLDNFNIDDIIVETYSGALDNINIDKDVNALNYFINNINNIKGITNKRGRGR